MNSQRTHNDERDIIIIGGGLAGLSLAILCAKSGLSVAVIEKGDYPKHKVCGEYISMESYDFVQGLGVPLDALDLPKIKRFVLTSHHNLSASCALEMGGFGISRYMLDDLLAQKAEACGVILYKNERVVSVKHDAAQQKYMVQTQQNTRLEARLVVGAYGRVSGLGEQKMQTKNAPEYIGIKYHLDSGPPADTIEIHNFEGGYCGISQIENGKFCLCYLAKADRLRALKGNIEAFEAEILMQNPFLKTRLQGKKIIKAVTTSQIRFGVNDLTRLDYPCIGDAAGFIPPITGNGMSLAFRAASVLHNDIVLFFEKTKTAQNLAFLQTKNQKYAAKYLNFRIKQGIFLQKILFLRAPFLNKLLMRALTRSPFLMRIMTRQAVGERF
jgi:menaquinone-9 beta-reductase